MISVKLVEQPRMFNLFIGSKKVGRVRAWRNDHCEAWMDDPTLPRGERFLRSEPTLRRAMQAVLCAAGYGKAKSHKVEWRKCR